jgi:hypothetical protein
VWNLKSQGDVMFDDRTLIPLGFIVHAFIKVWIASEACYRIAELAPWSCCCRRRLALGRW